jgi:hypothetical protein
MGKIQSLADYFHINKSDLIEEHTNSLNYPKIVDYYNLLNDLGKHEAEKRVQELTYLPKYASGQLLNAAHERTDITITDEMKQHDDNIMNDDNF